MVINGNPYLKDRSDGRIAYVQAVVDFNCPLVKAFVDAGVPVLTGTDAPVPGVAPGFALHDEFEALSRCGMSNPQILESTTRLSAEWLGTLRIAAPWRRANAPISCCWTRIRSRTSPIRVASPQ